MAKDKRFWIGDPHKIAAVMAINMKGDFNYCGHGWVRCFGDNAGSDRIFVERKPDAAADVEAALR